MRPSLRCAALAAAFASLMIGTAPVRSAEPDASTSEFLHRALKYGRVQASLARLAGLRSANAAVRDFARGLQRDLDARNERLAKIAGRDPAGEARDIETLAAVPDYSAQGVPFRVREFHRLRVLSGAAFDRQFLKFAIIACENAIRGYEGEAGSPDRELRTIATEALPQLRTRLGEARRLLADMGEERP